MSARKLRIGLLRDPQPNGAPVDTLADGLRAAGHDVVVPDARPLGLAESVLRKRGFTGPLTHLPAVTLALRGARPDLVHAFSAPDAAVAEMWGRRAGARTVFTCCETLDRGRVSDRRLRLRLLDAALEESDAAVAAGEQQREALWRWMALDVPVLAPDDVSGHVALYRKLLLTRQ